MGNLSGLRPAGVPKPNGGRTFLISIFAMLNQYYFNVLFQSTHKKKLKNGNSKGTAHFCFEIRDVNPTSTEILLTTEEDGSSISGQATST